MNIHLFSVISYKYKKRQWREQHLIADILNAMLNAVGNLQPFTGFN